MARVLRKGEERQLRQKEGTMYTCQKGKNLCVEKTVLSFDGFIEGWDKNMQVESRPWVGKLWPGGHISSLPVFMKAAF
jgi:hypothetical protein